MLNKKLIAAAALALTSPFAFAQQNVQPNSQGNEMGMIDMLQKLQSQGYSAFQEVDHDRNVYEVSATNPDGKYVEVEVDSKTGKVLRIERDD